MVSLDHEFFSNGVHEELALDSKPHTGKPQRPAAHER
jgi:hypothetical protein